MTGYDIGKGRTIRIEWNDALPPEKPPEEKEIERWDSWFASCGLKEEWGKIKGACAQVGATHNELIGWARITELTRLDALIAEKKANDG